MLPAFREVAVTTFRDGLADHIRFVSEGAGQVYLTRFGRRVAALVPVGHADLMAEVDTMPLRQVQARNEEALRAWEQLRRMSGWED